MSLRSLSGTVGALVACTGLVSVSNAMAVQTPSVSMTANSVTYGADPAVVMQVSGAPPGGVPTGTVVFTVDSHRDGPPVPLDSNGRAAYHPSFPLDVGSMVNGQYSGDATYSPAVVGRVLDIRPATTATELTSSANPATPGGQVTITATTRNQQTGITPFGSVQFSVDGKPVLDRIPLDDDGQAGIVASGLRAGDFGVTAGYRDDTGQPADFLDSDGSLTQHVTTPNPLAPAAPPPPQPAPAPTPPALAALVGGGHARTTVRGRTITVTTGLQIICPLGPSACAVQVEATTRLLGASAAVKVKRTTVSVGRAAFTVAADTTADVAFPLNRRGVRLLRARGRLHVELDTTATVGGGPPNRLQTAVTARLARSKNPRRSRVLSLRQGGSG